MRWRFAVLILRSLNFCFLSYGVREVFVRQNLAIISSGFLRKLCQSFSTEELDADLSRKFLHA